MMSIWRYASLIVCIISIAVAVPVVLSGTLRSAYMTTIDRKIASIWPPEYAFVGDSLTENCNWRWELGTFSVINLAVGGVDIRDIGHQLTEATALKVKVIFIEAGINDVILESAPTERISQDFEYLLQQIPVGQKAVVTLIPLVSIHSFTDKIEAANSTIASLAESRGLTVIDLNPKLASEGIRNAEMTTDGIHFNVKACQIWSDEIRAKAASLASASSGTGASHR